MKPIRLFPACLFLCFFLICACQREEGVVGQYKAIRSPHEGISVTLELKADGKGSWISDDGDVEFGWENRDTQIWLHTKSGGVIAGQIDQGNTITIILPGVGEFLFEKIEK